MPSGNSANRVTALFQGDEIELLATPPARRSLRSTTTLAERIRNAYDGTACQQSPGEAEVATGLRELLKARADWWG
jgi:hypothetical protein